MAQSASTGDLTEMQKQLAFLEGQMRILNKAIPRLQARIKDLQTDVEN